MAYTSSASTYAGSLGGGHRVNAVTDIVSQNEEANYTVVRFYGFMTKASGSGAYNFDPTYCNIQPNGELINGNVNGYDSRSSGGPWYGITADRGYYHDANGNLSVQAYFYHNASNLPYLGEGWTVHTCTLPSYYRYADPTYVEANSVTDIGFNWRVDTNRLCDQLAISLDGGAWQYFGGDFTSKTVSLGGAGSPLISGHTYSVRISLRRKNSGFWKEAGNWSVTTNGQNNFFDMADF